MSSYLIFLSSHPITQIRHTQSFHHMLEVHNITLSPALTPFHPLSPPPHPLPLSLALSAGRLMQGLIASVGFDADSGRYNIHTHAHTSNKPQHIGTVHKSPQDTIYHITPSHLIYSSSFFSPLFLLTSLLRSLEGGNVPLALNPRATPTSSSTAVAMVTDATAQGQGLGQGAAQGQGLRQDTFVAFVMMHFIGHNDITVPIGTSTHLPIYDTYDTPCHV